MRSRQRAHPGIGVAVMYCEWLGRPFPGGGRSARRHLVDPLGAEVLIAGTFLQRDCEGGGGGCLLQRVEGLRPLAATRLDPMLSLDELRQLVSHAPHWPAVLRAFDPALSWRGLTPWSPLLGNANVSILRQLHDCARCLTLLDYHLAATRQGAHTAPTAAGQPLPPPGGAGSAGLPHHAGL